MSIRWVKCRKRRDFALVSFRGEKMAGNITTKLLYQGCDTFLQAVLKKRDKINEKQLQFINGNTDKGFLNVRWEKTATRNVLKYNVSNMTALSEYIKQTMPQDKYFAILSQFQKIVEFCMSATIPYDNILLNDLKNVYFDVEKQKLYVAYLPLLENGYRSANMIKFLNKLNKNANITITNGTVMQKYSFFLEEQMNAQKDKGGFISPKSLHTVLHDVLMVPEAAEQQMSSNAAPVNIAAAEVKSTAPADDDSDHTILVNRNRNADCPAFLKDENNREIPITRFPFTIGRRPDNDLALTDKGTVSKEHAVITCSDGSFYIEDKGSANGTFLNNCTDNAKRISKEQLNSGDVIYFCDVPYVFTVNASDSATVIVGDKNSAAARKADPAMAKKIAYLVNSSSKERIPVFVYPFTCAELSGLIIGRENNGSRHSIFIENISCPSLSVEGCEVPSGEKTSIFSGCNFLYHGIVYTFYEEN